MKIARSLADWFFITGVGIAFAFLLLWALHPADGKFARSVNGFETWLFPCSLMLKAVEGSSWPVRAGLFVMACLTNGLCYYALGFLVASASRLLSHDGTR
jgi:hypothetical protein